MTTLTLKVDREALSTALDFYFREMTENTIYTLQQDMQMKDRALSGWWYLQSFMNDVRDSLTVANR